MNIFNIAFGKFYMNLQFLCFFIKFVVNSYKILNGLGVYPSLAFIILFKEVAP